MVPPKLTRLASTRCASNGARSGWFYSFFFQQLGVDGPSNALCQQVYLPEELGDTFPGAHASEDRPSPGRVEPLR